MGLINDIPVAFCAILQFPHGQVHNFRRVHRLVVLPDYQGIGIGKRMLNFLGDLYRKQNYRFIITSSHPSIIHSMNNDKTWKLLRFGRVNLSQIKGWDKIGSFRRITACFEYIK